MSKWVHLNSPWVCETHEPIPSSDCDTSLIVPPPWLLFQSRTWWKSGTEVENKRCCEMPCVLAQAFGTGAGRLFISPATWAHVCAAHMLPLPSETGEGALASHEEAFWSLSNVSFPPGDLLRTKWQCPQVMHYSAATWGPQMCCASSSQDVLCPGDVVPLFWGWFCFSASG